MRPPTFLGIGVPRAGTTWLHNLLRTHPDVFVSDEKEIHYFDNEYERGREWYETFFPLDSIEGVKHAGEFTPHYLFDERVPSRIQDDGAVEKLLLILRDPVDRAVSHYRWRILQDGYTGSFSKFLEDYPEATEWSRYAEPLQRFRDVFPRSDLLVLIHEEMFEDEIETAESVASFLGIEPDGFDEAAAREQVNSAPAIERKGLFKLARKASDLLWMVGAGGVVETLKDAGLDRDAFVGEGDSEVCSREERSAARRRLADDTDRVEEILGRSLPWET